MVCNCIAGVTARIGQVLKSVKYGNRRGWFLVFLNLALYIRLVYSSCVYIVGRQTLPENHLTVVNLLRFLMFCFSILIMFRRRSDKVETNTSAAL